MILSLTVLLIFFSSFASLGIANRTTLSSSAVSQSVYTEKASNQVTPPSGRSGIENDQIMFRPAFFLSLPSATPQTEAACSYIGLFSLYIHGVSHDTNYFNCYPKDHPESNNWQQIIADLSSPIASSAESANPGPLNCTPPYCGYSSNINYAMTWSSGSCTNGIIGVCADSNLGETGQFVFNTPSWSLQDNAYGNSGCGPTINYQITIAPGSSSNSYNNQFYIGWNTYPYCLSTSYGYNWYSFLSGTNINEGDTLEEWYNINSNGYPTSATYSIIFSNGQSDMYTFSMPSGGPHIAINAWELVAVCKSGGCSTTFSSGSGFFNYFQKNIEVTSANKWSVTDETSNCLYASSPNNYGNSVQQSMDC